MSFLTSETNFQIFLETWQKEKKNDRKTEERRKTQGKEKGGRKEERDTKG